MADLPPFSFFSSPSRAGASTLSKEMEMALATELIQQLNEPDHRENALHQLSKVAIRICRFQSGRHYHHHHHLCILSFISSAR